MFVYLFLLVYIKFKRVVYCIGFNVIFFLYFLFIFDLFFFYENNKGLLFLGYDLWLILIIV